MKKTNRYSNIEEIRADLKIYQLERQIAYEQIKRTGNSVKEVSLMPTRFFNSTLVSNITIATSIFKLIKKMF